MPVIHLTAGMFPEVYAELLRALNPNMTADEWRVAFSDHGWHDEDHFGYVLIEDGRPAGVLGALFSRRIIGGSEKKFCNLHGWYVKPEHRAKSLLMMRPALALKDHTLTDFTASPDVIVMFKRLGFATLDSHVWVLPKLPHVRGRKLRFEQWSSGKGVADMIFDPVTEKLVADHQGLDCRHLAFTDGRESCVVIFSRMASVKPPHCEIHHISNPSLFRRYHREARSRLLEQTGTGYVVVESRLLPGGAPFAFKLKMLEKLYRSPDVPAASVDNLYTEIVLLKLATPYQGIHLAARQQIREATLDKARRWLKGEASGG
jgi:hypothetical protein